MFHIHALKSEAFSSLYGLSDSELESRGMVPVLADAYPGYPCRVSLDFAALGSRMILLNYHHHDVSTPYRSNHAIYVRDGAETLCLEPGDLAPVLKRDTPVAVRAFGASGLLKTAELVQGPKSGPVFDRLLEAEEVDYLHVHFAAYGCYALRVTRG